MARKRRAPSPPVDPIPSPIDDPPTASSSSDSDEEQQPLSSQPKEEEVVEKEQEASEEEDGDEEDEDDDDDDEEEIKPPVSSQSTPKFPPPASANSQPKPSPSSSESGSESDDESESDDDAPLANSKVKPLASKPMNQKPTPKAQAQASSPPARSGAKRPAVHNNNASDSKRAKKKPNDTAGAGSSDETEPEDDVKKSGDDSKKQFSRVWSADDEITIVKGLIDFLSQTGNDPVKYNTVFYEHVKKSLHFDASCSQLTRKIRRLKEKFKANAKKGENGEDPVFSKPHEKKLYELSKKFWGNEINDTEEKGKGKKQPNGKLLSTPKKEVLKKAPASASAKKQPPAKKLIDETKEENGSSALVALKESGKVEADKVVGDSSSILSEMFRFDKCAGLSGLSEDVVKRGVELLGESQKAELEGRWKKLQVAELELFMKRAKLVEDQARLILDAYKSAADH